MDQRINPPIQAALDAFDDIARFTAGLSRDTFAQQQDTQLIVERLLVMIGAGLMHASRADPDIAASMPGFADLIATRDHVLHQYWDVDTDRVWDVAVARRSEHATHLRALLVEETAPLSKRRVQG